MNKEYIVLVYGDNEFKEVFFDKNDNSIDLEYIIIDFITKLDIKAEKIIMHQVYLEYIRRNRIMKDKTGRMLPAPKDINNVPVFVID